MLEPGHTLERYVVESVIGQGGMATVYKVRHSRLNSAHAIKVLGMVGTKMAARLLQEGQLQASLRHPNIVAVTDVLEFNGAPALVMELVCGPSLSEWLLQNRPDADLAVELFAGIVRGVGHAHNKGMIHRDLKPANVLLAHQNGILVPKVTDFGLAKSVATGTGITQSGVSMGTPEFMAPEQIRDASNVDHRADMFSLGCILYQMLSGRSPFGKGDIVRVFNAVTRGEYMPIQTLVSDVPRNVKRAVTQLLLVDMEERLSSCDDLLALLGEGGSRPTRRSLVDAPPIQEASQNTRETMFEFSDSGESGPTLLPEEDSEHEIPHHVGEPERVKSIRSQRWLPLFIALALGGGMLTGTLILMIFSADHVWRVRSTKNDAATAVQVENSTEPNGESEGTEEQPSTDAEAATSKPDVAAQSPDARSKAVRTPGTSKKRSSRSAKPRKATKQSAPAKENVEEETRAASAESEAGQPGQGLVLVSGDAANVWLLAGGRRLAAPGTAPAGTYRVEADFGIGAPVVAGEVTIMEDKTVTLTCDSFMMQCQ